MIPQENHGSDLVVVGHLMDIKEFLGRLDAKSEATKEHLISVSAKADGIRDDFDKHREDLNAHGKNALKAEGAANDSVWQKWVAVLALAVALVTLALEFGAK